MIARLSGIGCLAAILFAQSQTANVTSGHRMEVLLDRLDSGSWHAIDPGLVLDASDRVRFRFRTNFDGYLYVTNQSTSGKYEQLFPREETGQDNRIVAGKEYQIPSTNTVFRISGPPGHEIVYWLVAPARLAEGVPSRPGPPAGNRVSPPKLIPRCDDAILRSRGDCIDDSAGPKLVPRDVELPRNLTAAAGKNSQDLLFLRQKDASVISSPVPLNGPVLYEFRLAHR